MNSVLQVLLHCPPFMRFFLGDHHNRLECMARSRRSPPGTTKEGGDSPDLSRRMCLACEMDVLFTNCFSGKTAPFSPHAFLHAVWSNAEYFAGYDQQDAHEFFTAALASIYSGLLSLKDPIDPPTSSVKRSLSLRRSFGSLDLQRVFTGVLRSDVTCLHCRSKSTKYEEFQDISLDLSRLPGSAEDESEDTSLKACLQSFTRQERLSSNERCWCSHCASYQDSMKQLSIQRLPNVLCFHLKRFKHSSHKMQPSTSTKIESFVEFPLYSLNMRPHTSASVCSGDTRTIEPLPEQLYDLFGVVVHHGTMSNGHYTNFVRCQASWFHCDDANIAPAQEDDVRSCVSRCASQLLAMPSI